MCTTLLDKLILQGKAALILERKNHYEFTTPAGRPVIIRPTNKRARILVEERLALVFGAGPVCFAHEVFHAGERIADESYLTIEEAAKAWAAPRVLEGEIEDLNAWAAGEQWAVGPRESTAPRKIF